MTAVAIEDRSLWYQAGRGVLLVTGAILMIGWYLVVAIFRALEGQ